MAKVERSVLRLGEDLRPFLPYLRYLLSVDPGDAAVLAMDPQQRRGEIFDALRRAKVPFRIYAGDGFPQVGLLSGISLYDDVEDLANFAGDIDDPTYDAAYTFIEPRYDTLSQNLGLPFVNNSQHPANSVALGESLIKTVYEAIRNSPHWNQSMLIITWDEHGGFFDHVPPPSASRIPTRSAPNGIRATTIFSRSWSARMPAT